MPAPYHSIFFTGRMPFLPPTNSVKALKAIGSSSSLCSVVIYALLQLGSLQLKLADEV